MYKHVRSTTPAFAGCQSSSGAPPLTGTQLLPDSRLTSASVQPQVSAFSTEATAIDIGTHCQPSRTSGLPRSRGAPPTPAARSTASGRRPSLALRTHAEHTTRRHPPTSTSSATARRDLHSPRGAGSPRNARPIRSLHRWALADHAANLEMAGATIKPVVVGYRVAAEWGDGERQNRNPPLPSPAPRHGPVGPKGRLG
jgi:hypothetical protein